MSIEPKMSDPDWGRVLVQGDTKLARVGDPTRWGVQVDTLIPRTFAAAFEELTTASPQIVNVGTRDSYSRSWALLGTLRMPSVTWGNANFSVNLEVTMGVGQVQMTHQIVLETQPGVTPLGICFTQNVTQGGPYSAPLETVGGVVMQTRPFAVIGGLIGQTISARVLFNFETLLPIVVPGLPATMRTSLIVCPFAAGEEL